MEYRSEIDGLRAVAVLPVILFHAGVEVFGGGFVGVDVFFVISGYLITSIILADMNKGKFSLVTFYERRARRILPALFFLMLCAVPLAWMVLAPVYLRDFSQSLTAVSFFSSNILFWKESGYFAAAAEMKPLLHTWSLAVEEQFYLLFPLFLMILWRFRKRVIFGALLAVAVISLAAAQWGAYNRPSAAFFLLPARAWELAIGALIAFGFTYKREYMDRISAGSLLKESAGAAGLALILYSSMAFSGSTPFPGFYALLPTVGTALVIVFSRPDTLVGRFLSLKPLVGIGLMSYSLYLWHQPLFVFARHWTPAAPGPGILSAMAVLSFLAAYLAWRFIETPFRDKAKVRRPALFRFAAAGSLLFALAGFTGHVKDGFGNRTNAGGVPLKLISDKVENNYGLSEACAQGFTLSAECRTSDAPEILVWGDSYGMHLVDGILASQPRAKIIQMTKGVCGPLFGMAPVTAQYPASWAKGCLESNERVREWLRENKTVKYVVLSSPFSKYLEGGRVLADGKVREAGSELTMKYLERTLEELKGMGLSPVLFSPTPKNGEDIGGCLAKAEIFSRDPSDCDFPAREIPAYALKVKAMLQKLSEKYRVVFLYDEICPGGVCRASVQGTYIYRDDGHLSVEGSSFLGRKMDFYGLITGGKASGS